MLPETFTSLPDLVRLHAGRTPEKPAIIAAETILSWQDLDTLTDRIAAHLSAHPPGSVIAITSPMHPNYIALWMGALRAGHAVAPLSDKLTPEALAMQLEDCAAAQTFDTERVATLHNWLPQAANPPARTIDPASPFNLIYSSGTTGRPKGIVQPHAMRWAHIQRGAAQGYGPASITLISTPLYSNTTLVSLIPTLGLGGTIVLLPKFDTKAFLTLSQTHGVTHAMLVPVQYQRLMADPDFDHFDLSSYQAKFCTSAPFSAALKAQILARWPGGLTEYYGMTEGGGTCILQCHNHPGKLATVGQPAAGSDIRLIDDSGAELPRGATHGAIGEVVGRSPAMMKGYHNLPEASASAEWYSPEGERFIRTGDIGRFDEEGFLTLLDRKKDMIISGGFNLYPSDLESVLTTLPQIHAAAVVGIPSEKWGETPIAFVTLNAPTDAAALLAAANAKLGSMQRLADLVVVESLPRSDIGKVLKRELRDAYGSGKTSGSNSGAGV